MEDRCIVCGAVIPEGRQICLMCEEQICAQYRKQKQKMDDDGRFLLILIALAVFFTFATSLLFNWA